MTHSTKLIFALLLCGAFAQAAVITITPLPAVLNPADTFDVYLGLKPDGAEIVAFSIDLLFTDDLVAGTPVELGFFAANGVFFNFLPGVNSLTAISDAASGPSGLTAEEFVVQVPFTFLGARQTPTAISIDSTTSYLLDASFMDVPFTIETVTAPAAATPEPATFGLGCAALAAMSALRRRRCA